jgi:hypothetical protein
MIMKKFIQFSIAASVLAAASAANALSFETFAGTPFTEYFSVTPTGDDKLILSVSGLSSQFSSLTFEIGTTTSPTMVSVTAGTTGAIVKGAFNDRSNKTVSFLGDTSYTLKIDGVTKSAIPGTFGVVSISALGATVAALPVSPVPEPESYAMLLAGLGVIGTIARRRLKVNAA